MNKLILLLAMALFGCATSQPTRPVLNCQSEYIVGDSALFVGGSKVNDEITCKMVQVQQAPKATPLQVPAELVK